MRYTVRLGRVFGIPIAANWSTLLILALVGLLVADRVLPAAAPGHSAWTYWAVGVGTAVVFLACLLAHELAHSVLAQRRGMLVRSITLWMLGGVSELEGEPPDPKTDLIIAVAGPLASLLAGLLLGAGFMVSQLLGASPLLAQSLLWLAMMNLILAVFNLLPGAPLDGGRVLRALLWRRYHNLARADVTAARAGRTLGLTIIWLGVIETMFLDIGSGIWTVAIGSFLVITAHAEVTARLIRQALDSASVAQVMHPAPECAHAWHNLQACIDHSVARSEQSLFPVVEHDGHPIGVITIDQLIAVPAERRSELLVRAVMTRLPARNVLAPATPAPDLINLRPIRQLVAVVADDHHVTGMVTTAGLRRIQRRALLLRSQKGPSAAARAASSPRRSTSN
ncbi:site-2 protease family protein [Nonomuraea jabiensis]|uniref:site-2 protease family protein n=1 Tax=Nonomuraea jabiensis TaxID=882448 RepID=UPI003D7601ED